VNNCAAQYKNRRVDAINDVVQALFISKSLNFADTLQQYDLEKSARGELILDVVLILRVPARLVVQLHNILGFTFRRALDAAEG